MRVAVIGAGFAGIATAYYLSRAGIDNFLVYEKALGPGGVWWDSRYPGAAVDTPTHMYSFSFKRHGWTKSHADQAELQAYMAETIEGLGLGSHFRYNTPVKAIAWQEQSMAWLVQTDTETVRYDYVVSAVGLLNVPKLPDWPGMDSFTGKIFHTSQWDSSIQLAGKRVAVVGTGSTAAQVVPSIADEAEHVYVFQREPGWINPKPVHVYSEEELQRLKNPLFYKRARIKGYIDAAKSREGGDIHKEGSKANLAAMARCRTYINSVFKDRPDLAEAVMPSYGYFGKRPIKDSNFYPALLRENVELVPCSVASVTPEGLVDSLGKEREVDVIITATGFHANEYLRQLEVRGASGTEIHDFWKGEARAFLGMMVPGFPNFFMLYGPNTNSPVTLFMLETQAKFAVRAMRATRRRHARTVDVRRRTFDRYDKWMQDQMKNSVWSSSNNYFKTSSGRVVTQWPTNPLIYWALTHVPMSLSLAFRRRMNGVAR
jgi:cation diffusion facilitator CzcD-associated flavoprotein CzcO